MQAVRFSVRRWSAWAPGLAEAGQWSAWAQGREAMAATGSPSVDFVAPLLRRRLSELSRMALWAAYQCAAGQHDLPTVFASPHGEIHRTTKLLDELAAGEPLSPNGFSLSVHNTASGLYAIASGNRAPATAVAAGLDTLALAVIDAVGQLARGAAAVMVVMADEPLPAFYQRWAEAGACRFALALLLEPAGDGPAWQLARCDEAATGAADGEAEPHGLGVLRLLNGVGSERVLAGERHSWRWSRP
jgi:hypothetical protein